MSKPIVLVDMDGVLADFSAAVITHVKKLRPDLIIPPLTKFRVHHNFDDKAVQRDIIAYITSEKFFRELPLIDHALEGWQRLIDLGYHPRICSTPIRTNPWSEVEKRAWVAEHIGVEAADDAIITREKYLQDGISLIDDRIDLHHTDQAPWQQILFDAPYNQDFETDYRLRGWQDPGLGALLERIATPA